MLQIAAGWFFGLASRSTSTLTGAPSTATRSWTRSRLTCPLARFRLDRYRRVCNDTGLKPDVGTHPELVAAASATFEVWHMSTSAAEITWRAWQGDATPPTDPFALLGAPEMDGIGEG